VSNLNLIERYAPTDALQRQAWVDCLLWASGHPEILQHFRHDSGIEIIAPRNQLDAMIDEATGRNEHVATQFVEWFNENIWGPDEPPEAA
jgi:hypothetical protein